MPDLIYLFIFQLWQYKDVVYISSTILDALLLFMVKPSPLTLIKLTTTVTSGSNPSTLNTHHFCYSSNTFHLSLRTINQFPCSFLYRSPWWPWYTCKICLGLVVQFCTIYIHIPLLVITPCTKTYLPTIYVSLTYIKLRVYWCSKIGKFRVLEKTACHLYAGVS